MVSENLGYDPECILGIDRSGEFQLRLDFGQELVERPQLLGSLGGLILVVVGAAHEDRQLRAQVGGKIRLHAVSQGVEHRSKHMHATCRSGPISVMISSSQMFVICSVLSNTSSPVALIQASFQQVE